MPGTLAQSTTTTLSSQSQGFPGAGSGMPIGAGRIAVVDTAKAIGIVLVVAGHATGISVLAATLIYAMHMPLFFFLSGYLMPEERAKRPLLMHLRNLGRDLLVPYAIFFAGSWVYWLLSLSWGTRAQKFASVAWYDPLAGFVTGLGDRLVVNPALWFLPCLFSTTLLYLGLRRLIGPRYTLLVALVLGGLCMLLLPGAGFRLPWGLDIAWVAMIFFAIGALLRDAHVELTPGNRLQRLLVLPGIAMLFATLAVTMGRVDLNMAHFGPNPALYLLTAGAGIAMILLLASLLSQGRVLHWIASNTLIIFGTHAVTMNFANGVARLAFSASETFIHSPTWLLVSTVIGIAAAAPIGKVLRRTLPAIFERRIERRRYPRD